MKMLVITDSFPPYHSGGYELRCKDVIDRLIQRGHEVTTITTKIPKSNKQHMGESEQNIFRQLNIVHLKKNIIEKIYIEYLDLLLINKVIQNIKPDLIYLWHTINLSKSIFPYLASCNIPVVYDEGGWGFTYAYNHHGVWYYFIEYISRYKLVNFLKKSLGRVISKLSHNLLQEKWIWPKKIKCYFNSNLNREIARKSGIEVNNYPVIYSGIDLNHFPSNIKHPISSPCRILVPGRIDPRKGQVDSLYLLALITQFLNAEVIIVGKQHVSDYVEEILRKVRELGLENRVEILPMVDPKELARLYRSANYCFFSSYHKSGFSRIPLEAMASGCLVISYGNEGSNEIIEDHVTGLIVPEGAVHIIADQIIYLSNHPDEYQYIVNNARNFVEKNHSMEQYVEKIETFLIDSFHELSERY